MFKAPTAASHVAQGQRERRDTEGNKLEKTVALISFCLGCSQHMPRSYDLE